MRERRGGKKELEREKERERGPLLTSSFARSPHRESERRDWYIFIPGREKKEGGGNQPGEYSWRQM